VYVVVRNRNSLYTKDVSVQ